MLTCVTEKNRVDYKYVETFTQQHRRTEQKDSVYWRANTKLWEVPNTDSGNTKTVIFL
jgi:hypothetical protein